MNKVRLHIDNITPGMKLAEPITTPAGITLMPAGIRLTPMFLVRIKKWNVEELDVFVEKTANTTRTEKQSGKDTQTLPKTPGKQTPRAIETTPAESEKPRPRARPSSTRTMTAAEEEFARNLATEISRAFVNVKHSSVMMQLRVSVIKRLIMHGRDGTVNVLRRASRSSGEESA